MNFPTANLSLVSIDFDQLEKKYEQAVAAGKPGRFLATSRFKSGLLKVTAQFDAPFCTNGINYHEFDDGKKAYSLGVEVDLSIIDALKVYEDVIKNFAPDDFIFDSCIKNDEQLYLKCKLSADGKQFAFKSNLKISPKNYAEVSTCSAVTATVDLSGYFNLKEKKMGIMFALRDTVFV